MEKQKDDKKDLIIKITLVIIIILLLIHNCTLIKNNSDLRIMGGNVKIIEFTINGEAQPINENPGQDDPQHNNPGTISENPISVFDAENDKYTWNGSTDLPIFSNPMYAIEGVIAPESSNTYQFVVKNDTKIKLKYSLSFSETNPYNMNLKYKLKKNDTYIISDYVSYSELSVLNQKLDVGKNDTFYLEWKWISTDHDTEAGYNQANYSLKINVKAESING